jgi:hypothetical protein
MARRKKLTSGGRKRLKPDREDDRADVNLKEGHVESALEQKVESVLEQEVESVAEKEVESAVDKEIESAEQNSILKQVVGDSGQLKPFTRFNWMADMINHSLDNYSCPLVKQGLRLGYSVCIHTHSPSSVLVSKLNATEFRIKDMEMIKGIYDRSRGRNYDNDELLIVPIIYNTMDSDFDEAMMQYPNTNAILVRNHGLVVFADSQDRAKIMVECYEYLFEIWYKMHVFGVPLLYH